MLLVTRQLAYASARKGSTEMERLAKVFFYV